MQRLGNAVGIVPVLFAMGIALWMLGFQSIGTLAIGSAVFFGILMATFGIIGIAQRLL